ncbi:MAG: SAM-dependent chlorinase/fluorinase [Gammaproteobacteria bacterium]|nr:SAM-dependent chlorinase/fluorinase [Gammaproteobacteria bacterium]
MIVLFTDFGFNGPYLGQMKAVLTEMAPSEVVLDLMADAPMFRPRASAHLLSAYSTGFAPGTVFLCVVDPGVGSQRRALVIRAREQYFIGPDNGLFYRLLNEHPEAQVWQIPYEPDRLSASFHGRDLFAPVAARIAHGEPVPGQSLPVRELVGAKWPKTLQEILYIDHYGNAITGLREGDIGSDVGINIAGENLMHARTFSDVENGALFWYINSSGLVEIAQNGGSAAKHLGLTIGTEFRLNH